LIVFVLPATVPPIVFKTTAALPAVPNVFDVAVAVLPMFELPLELSVPLICVLRNCAVPAVCVTLFAKVVVPLWVVGPLTISGLPALPTVVVVEPDVLMFVAPSTFVVEAALPIETVPLLVPVLMPVLSLTDALTVVVPAITLLLPALPIETVPVLVPVLMFVALLADALTFVGPLMALEVVAVIVFVGAVMVLDVAAVMVFVEPLRASVELVLPIEVVFKPAAQPAGVVVLIKSGPSSEIVPSEPASIATAFD